MILFILEICIQAFFVNICTHTYTQSHAHWIWKETHSSTVNGNHGEWEGYLQFYYKQFCFFKYFAIFIH